MPLPQNQIEIQVVRKHDFARIPIPVKGYQSVYDLYACEHDVVQPRQWKSIKIGIFFILPEGYEIQVLPSTELALAKGITILNSPVCIQQMTDVEVIIHNNGEFPFHIFPGDKIALADLRRTYESVIIEQTVL